MSSASALRPAARRTRFGDLWKLGAHRLLCGDSTDPACVARLMAGSSADLAVIDPPYGVGYVGKQTVRTAITNDNLKGAALRSFLAASFTALPLKPGGAFYICAPSGATQTEFRLALGDAKLSLRQSLAWVKHHFVVSRQDYHNKFEIILYGWKDGAAHYFVPDRTQDTVWEFKKPHRNRSHPTEKPIPLVSRAIANSSRPNELVFDGFGGGGSVLLACENLGRRCRMIEVEPNYCDVTVARWEELTGQVAHRIRSAISSRNHISPPAPVK